MVKTLARMLRAILDELDDESPKHITQELRSIQENHLAHIYTRLGKLEGKMAILLGVSGMILMSVIGAIVTNFVK